MAVYNVKGVAQRDEPTKNHHLAAVPLSSTEPFQPIVLIFWLATFTLWFPVTALINIVSSRSRQMKTGSENPLKTTEHWLLSSKQQADTASILHFEVLKQMNE